MRLDGCSIRDFAENFANRQDLSLDLDVLAIRYKSFHNQSDFATILNKVLGVILKYGRGSFSDLGLTEEDIYSHGIHALANALDGWSPDKKVKFITYFYRMVHNAIITLQSRKCQRDYKKFHTSLDELVDDPDSNFDVSDKDTLSRHIRSRRVTGKESVEILTNISQDQMVELAYTLGISMSSLQLAFIVAKSKYRLATQEEEEKLKNSKKEWRQIKKHLKTLV